MNLGLVDVRICGTEGTVVGAVGIDPASGAQYRIVIARGTFVALAPPFGWDDDEFAFHEWGDNEDTLTLDGLMELAGDKSYWKAAIIALLDLQDTANAVIAERVVDFKSAQREQLNSLGADPESLKADPALKPPDEASAFDAFVAACDRRRNSSEFFGITLPPEADDFAPFLLRFGHGPDKPNQVFYEINSRMGVVEIYLNGLETTPDRYEEDIQNHCSDPWERLGLLRAAQDLIAIKQASYDLVAANAVNVIHADEHEAAVQRRFEEFQVGLRAAENAEVETLDFDDLWDAGEAKRTAAREALNERVRVFLRDGTP